MENFKPLEEITILMLQVTVGNTVSQSQGTLGEYNKMEEYILSSLWLL